MSGIEPALFEQIFGSQSAPLILCDRGGGVIAFNRAAAGLAPETSLLRVGARASDALGADPARFEAAFRIAAFSSGEVPLPPGAGEPTSGPREALFARRVAVPGGEACVLIERGPDSGLFGRLTRVAEELEAVRIRARRERMARRDLAQANERLSAFAAIAAHDLRAPIAQIISVLGHLRDQWADKLDPREIGWLDRLEADGLRSLRMVSDLLTFAQAERAPLNEEAVDLNAVVDAVLRDLAGVIRGKDARIARGELPTVRGDPSLLGILFQNLIANALKYASPERPPLIGVRCYRIGEREEVIEVSDNGIGFSATDAQRMFAPFERLSNAGRADGAGIGLATVKAIVARHGWSVTADGAEDEGARFMIRRVLAEQG